MQTEYKLPISLCNKEAVCSTFAQKRDAMSEMPRYVFDDHPD